MDQNLISRLSWTKGPGLHVHKESMIEGDHTLQPISPIAETGFLLSHNSSATRAAISRPVVVSNQQHTAADRCSVTYSCPLTQEVGHRKWDTGNGTQEMGHRKWDGYLPSQRL